MCIRDRWKQGELIELEDRLFFLNELHERTLKDFKPQGQIPHALLVRSTAPSDYCELPPDYGWDESLVYDLLTVEVPDEHLDLFEPRSIEAMYQAVIDYLSA